MDTITDIVRDRYADAARRVAAGGAATCGCGTAAGGGGGDPITSNLYGDAEASAVPEAALLASLGCGNPTALAPLPRSSTVSPGCSAASARPARPTGST